MLSVVYIWAYPMKQAKRLQHVLQTLNASMKQSGGNPESPRHLIFERVTDASILSTFSCGIDSMDEFIHEELQDYIWMGSCELYIIHEDEV